MSSRTVSVVLTAQVQNYLTNMKAAELRTLEVEKAARTATEQFRVHTQAVQHLGVGMLAVGAAAAAGLAIAVKASTEFGAKMAQLQSLSHANAGTMKQLSDAAMTVGTAYGFSASQVADAQIELVKAGVSVQAQLGGALKGALTLAAAGQIDVAQATEITTVAMTQFGLSAGQVPHLADLLAAGADKALGSVGDLGEALKNGGLQAHNMGLTIDDTVGTLSAFANAGILGAEAGTQLRSMFLRLQNPTSASRKTLDEYGISINDASGKFVGITKFAGELHDKLTYLHGTTTKLTDAQRNQALATIFGSHAIVGATVLYSDAGKAAEKSGTSIGDWIKTVNDAGFASAQAAGKMNSLQGDVQKLGAAFQTDLIKAGSAATGPLRNIVQDATAVVTALGNMNPTVQGGVMAAGALVAGVGLLGGAFLIAVPKVVAFKAAMTELEITGGGLARTLGKGGVILAGVTDIVGAFGALGTHGTASTQQISQSAVAIGKSWAGLDQTFKSAGSALDSGHGLKASLDELGDGSAFSSAGAVKIFDQLTLGIAHLSDVYKSNEANLDAMGQQLAGLAQQDYGRAAQSFDQLVTKYKLTGSEISTLLNSMPAYRDELAKQAAAAHVSASDQNLLLIAQGKGAVGAKVLAAAQGNAAAAAAKQAATIADLSGQASTATVNIDGLQKQIEGFGSAQLDARGATRAMYQAIDDATAAVKKNGHTLDVHTQKGRDNQAALDGIATAADAAASKTLKQTGDTAKAAAVMRTGRDAYIRAAEAMGLGSVKAGQLADQIGLIPQNITLAVKGTDLDPAVIKIKKIKDAMNNLDGTIADVEVAVQVAGGTSADAARIGRQLQLQSRAAGGSIDGSGPRGVDSVPALLAPGEHVLTTRDVDALGGQGGVYAFRAALHMASGGAVSDAEEAVARYRRAVAHASTRAAKSTAQQHLTDAESRLTSLRQGREDFVSGQRRAYGNPIDPLGYVDEVRQMSRDTSDFGSKRRASFDKAANRYESAIVKLSAASATAAAKLTDLQNSATQLRGAVSGAITGRYTPGGAAQGTPQASGWITSNGMRLRTYSSGPSAAGIAAYYTAGAATESAFAKQLKTLASRGLNAQLLAQLAQEADGPSIAATLMSASSSQIRTINTGFTGIQSAAGRAAATVTDDNYKAQIAAAEKNTNRITAQLKSDGEKLRKIIARAFGLKGYASGTTSAAAGIRWVGEDGPELVGFGGGEAVLNRADSARWVRGGGGGGSAAAQPVEVHIPAFPDTITIEDASGFTVPMRVIAHQVVSQRNDQIAVRLMGATA